MPVIVKAPKDGAKVADGDTLESLAQKAGAEIDWKMIARLNWGTDEPSEVARAIVETIGVKLKDYIAHSVTAKPPTPEKMPLAPHADAKATLRIPELYTEEKLKTEQTHTIKVRTLKPAVAVSITSLDKWFVPKIETCRIKYDLDGLKDNADKARIDVFASNYCACTAWNEGLGTFDAAGLESEPVYAKTDLEADERKIFDIEWKGDCTTKKGLFSVKEKEDDLRHVNVAFSPYTAQITYHKAALPEDKRPQILLKTFWPRWKMKENKHTVANVPASGEIAWTNAADQDGGAITVEDAGGMVVHRAALTPTLTPKTRDTAELERPDALKSGAQKITWNGAYRAGVLNGKMETQRIDDSAWTADMQAQFLYRSTPYKATVVTLEPELEADSLKIGWKVLNSKGKLKRGLYRIRDRAGRIVLQNPLPAAKMADGEWEVKWDGKYPEGVKNTLDGDEITPWDMPYRVEIEMHTDAGEAEGLALAVAHSEVRLYTHNETFAPKDPRYDPETAKPSLLLEPGPLLAKAKLKDDVDLAPDVEPDKKADLDAWVRYMLAEAGFHPGPLQDKLDPDFSTALKEFKRSVPADGSAAAGKFKRQKLGAANITKVDAALRKAIETLRGGDRRASWGDPAQIATNAEAPNLTIDQVRQKIADVTADIVLWVDERQYYTEEASGGPVDDKGRRMLKRNFLGLEDYRGDMVNGDVRVDRDANDIARPWLPMRATPALMKRDDELFHAFNKARVEATGADRDAMRAAIGPLRIDWTVDDLPFDVGQIDLGAYSAAQFDGARNWDPKTETRTRRYVTHALWDQKGQHTRGDTGRQIIQLNCPENCGGVRPGGGGEYAGKVFGNGAGGLWPWKATHEAADEAVSTVLHDHIHKDQGRKKLDAPLVAAEAGAAAAWFRPSRIAGDGYRLGARMTLKKAGANAGFPNIEALAQRYPATPQAHSARLRVWRRSSVRGMLAWSPNPCGFDAAFFTSFRNYYKAGNVYFVHEGGGLTTHDIRELFDDTQKPHKTFYKKIVYRNLKRNGVKTGFFSRKKNLDLHSQFPHPASRNRALGYDDLIEESKNGDPEDHATNLWNFYNDALLYSLIQLAEKRGFLRGHMLAEVVSSPKYTMWRYKCDVTAAHTYVKVRLEGHPAPPDSACPVVGCGGTLKKEAQHYFNCRFNFNGIGYPIGAAWNFPSADANIAVHEVGHHRHFEHSANGPGTKPDLHDHADNEVVTWTAAEIAAREIWWDDMYDSEDHDPAVVANEVAHRDHGRRWDRRCVMSYANDSPQYFCGKCVLRNRGWRVKGLPALDGKCREPA